MNESQPSSPTTVFCDELRKAREYQGISLAEIAAQTRLPTEYLDALEAGRLDVIPNPIRRAVIATYAKAAGMNADKVLRTLEELEGVQRSAAPGTGSLDRGGRERMTVGMTRTQIRTAWFASIAGNRLLHWSLTLLLLLVGALLAAQWHAGGQLSFGKHASLIRVGEPVSEFRTSAWFEYREQFADSLRYLVDFPTQEAVFTVFDTTDVKWFLGLEPCSSMLLYPHDKIKFIHQSGLRVESLGPLRGYMIADTDTFRAHVTKDSLVSWVVAPDAIQTDTVATDTDPKAAKKG